MGYIDNKAGSRRLAKGEWARGNCATVVAVWGEWQGGKRRREKPQQNLIGLAKFPDRGYLAA